MSLRSRRLAHPLALLALGLAVGCTDATPAARPEPPAQKASTPLQTSDEPVRVPIVSDSAVSFVVPIRECIARTAADSVVRVQAGAAEFRARNCAQCHNLDGSAAAGPDLRGVTARRSCDWVVALLTDTENMIQTDPDLQQLRVEHFLDMPNLGLTVAEARTVYAYLRVAAPAADTSSSR